MYACMRAVSLVRRSRAHVDQIKYACQVLVENRLEALFLNDDDW